VATRVGILRIYRLSGGHPPRASHMRHAQYPLHGQQKCHSSHPTHHASRVHDSPTKVAVWQSQLHVKLSTSSYWNHRCPLRRTPAPSALYRKSSGPPLRSQPGSTELSHTVMHQFVPLLATTKIAPSLVKVSPILGCEDSRCTGRLPNYLRCGELTQPDYAGSCGALHHIQMRSPLHSSRWAGTGMDRFYSLLLCLEPTTHTWHPHSAPSSPAPAR
jgi:hypothetical protein